MIIVVDALNKHEYSELLDQMFQLRARVFADRLGWEVNVVDGREIDKFDALDPAYVIGVDDDGEVVSCVRALQTTGPHMLADVFSAILHGEPPLRNAQLWESTRFCVDTQRLGRGRGPNTVSYATSELMIGSLEYAKASGIKDIVTVIDPVMDRVLKRSNCAPYGYVGETTPMGKVPAMAALLDCSDERIGNLREFADIQHDVFADEAEMALLKDSPLPEPSEENVVYHPAFAAGPFTARAALNAEQIAEYISDQFHNSATASEYEATQALLQRLTKREQFRDLEKMLERAVH